jgi:hypothetical protein
VRFGLLLLLGLVFATGLGVAAHLIARDTVALPVASIEAGEGLAPVQTRARTATDARTTTARTTTGRTTTRAARETATTTTSARTTTTDDRGRGRGRGRGGSEDDSSGSGSGSDSSGSGSSGSGGDD